MPKRNPKKAPAIDLDQLPPWLAVLEPALHDHFRNDRFSPVRIRRLAQVYVRWGAQLLEAAGILEVEMKERAHNLGRGPWQAGDPFGN